MNDAFWHTEQKKTEIEKGEEIKTLTHNFIIDETAQIMYVCILEIERIYRIGSKHISNFKLKKKEWKEYGFAVCLLQCENSQTFNVISA